VIPPRDVPALVQAITDLLADPARRKEMGRRGQERARREFSHEVMTDRVLALYEEAM